RSDRLFQIDIIIDSRYSQSIKIHPHRILQLYLDITAEVLQLSPRCQHDITPPSQNRFHSVNTMDRFVIRIARHTAPRPPKTPIEDAEPAHRFGVPPSFAGQRSVPPPPPSRGPVPPPPPSRETTQSTYTPSAPPPLPPKAPESGSLPPLPPPSSRPPPILPARNTAQPLQPPPLPSSNAPPPPATITSSSQAATETPSSQNSTSNVITNVSTAADEPSHSPPVEVGAKKPKPDSEDINSEDINSIEAMSKRNAERLQLLSSQLEQQSIVTENFLSELKVSGDADAWVHVGKIELIRAIIEGNAELLDTLHELVQKQNDRLISALAAPSIADHSS
ncbi:hypothetical protein B0H66DRAFT_609658, partial [Apodospora peruviana]